MASSAFRSVALAVKDRVATITLNRPAALNAVDAYMPGEIAAAVGVADRDDAVHVIVLQGAGRAFCAGYDLKAYAEAAGSNPGVQTMPWDPTVDYGMMYANTKNFASLTTCSKPTIAKVRGHAVAGGSDIALCCDLIMSTTTAKFGYPPARVWGCPTTAMWVHRVGHQQARRMMFTGDVIDGVEAKRIGLVLDAVPEESLDDATAALADRIGSVPLSQLRLHKLVMNDALHATGLERTQQLATLCDGIARHTPEGMWFKQLAEEKGFQEAVAVRDSGTPMPPPGVAKPTVQPPQ